MVVAFRAAGGEPEKRPSGGIHAIILGVRPQGIKSQAGRELVPVDQIARNLRLHEPVIRHVFVERANHPVAIAERVGVRRIHFRFQPVVGIARHVQPEPSPTLAMAWRGQQSLHYLLEGFGRRVGRERVHLRRSRRQSGQIEIGAPDERPRVGGRRGLDALGLHLRQQEPVHVVARPRLILHRGRRGLAHRLKRPERFLLWRDLKLGSLGRGRRLIGRPHRAGAHPIHQIRNPVVR